MNTSALTGEGLMKGLGQEVRKWGAFVRFSHTVFALPFALAAMVVAARDHGGWPGWRLAILILAAMVSARTCAMSFNRIADLRWDRLNPRTARRQLATGEIRLFSAWCLWGLSAAGLIATSYFINPLCFHLSPLALVVICFYSLTKRFTDFTHLFLGLALALAPLGAWLAVRAALAVPPVVLALAVFFWLVGFDIIYATQDYEFDRQHGLHSLVVRWGVRNALRAAFLAHLLMWGWLALFGLISHFRLAYFTGMFVILVSLVLEHWLARKRSLRWIHTSFFRLNALISVVFLTVTVAEVVFPGFRLAR